MLNFQFIHIIFCDDLPQTELLEQTFVASVLEAGIPK